MSDTIIVPAAEVDRAVYAGIAVTKDDAETDILAGIAARIAARRPDVTTAELIAAITAVQARLAIHRPPRHADLGHDSARLITRLLTRVVPLLTDASIRGAARDYSRAFFDSHRRGASLLRQVAPLDLQFDRFAEVARFRRGVWEGIHDLARANPAMSQAIDDGPIGQRLGVRTDQDAAAMLAASPMEPLRTFVATHRQGDGALHLEAGTITVAIADLGSATNAMINDYTKEVLSEVTKGEEKKEENLSEFEQAIRKAEEAKKTLDAILDGAQKGVKATFGVLSLAATKSGDAALAADIDEYSTIVLKMLDATKQAASAAIEIAKVIAKLDDITAEDVLLGASIAFNFAMIAVALKISGMFAKSKPPEQVILEQLQEIRKQIVALRDEMRVRFDRVEARLNQVYVGILNRLAEMDFDLGQIEGNVDELQLALYDLHAELQRLTRNVHALLEAAHRRELVEAINGFLRFRERTGDDLPLTDFRTAENKFFTWGHDHAKDILQAGADGRSFVDDDLLEELASAPLATNINYLRRFPAERFGAAPLSSVRLANPFDWIVAGEAYAQLCEENPAQAVPQERLQSLIAIGQGLGTTLSRIADPALLGALRDHYRTSFAALKAEIAGVEAEFRIDPDHQVQGIDLWGGVEQAPNAHFLDASFAEIRRCDGSGRGFGGGRDTAPVPVSIGSGFDYLPLRPFLIASNLSRAVTPGVAEGLAALGACVRAHWSLQESAPAPGGRIRAVYRCGIDVNIRYGADVIFAHRYTTTETLQLLVPKVKFESGTFDPATDPLGKDPHLLLFNDERHGKNLWAKLDTFQVSRGLQNPALLTATRALVARKLVLLQRRFYAEVVRRFVSDGDGVQRAGQVLSGSKLLWQAFVTTGLPLRIESNEFLHALLYGSDAILGGRDADGEDNLLDDVQDLYAFFSAREEDPPPANIIGEVEGLATTRAERLATLLAEIVAIIEESGEPEPPELFAPTLLRLSLLGT